MCRQGCERVQEGLQQFVCSADLEVQDRASSATHLLQAVATRLKEENSVAQIATDMMALFAGELNPVASKAQKKVQIPEG